MPDLWLMSFARPGREECHRALAESAAAIGGFHGIHAWDARRLEQCDTFRRHPHLAGADSLGLEFWKPGLILDQLRALPAGDMLLFHDAAVGYWGPHCFDAELSPLVEWALACNRGVMPGVWLPEEGRNARWTPRSCFRLMGCDDPYCWDIPQIQTTYSLWRNDDHSLELLRAWHQACLGVAEHAADRTQSADNFADFESDRGGRSVLTNLTVTLHIGTFGESHETTSVITHPGTDPIPASDIGNLLARIRSEASISAITKAESPRAHAPRMALFTSIPPRLDRWTSQSVPIGRWYQDRCIRSWIASGFDVYAVHFREEAPDRDRFPEVRWVEIGRTEDDSPKDTKPSIRAIAAVMARVDAEIIGLINADILLAEDSGWTGRLVQEIADSAVVFCRAETPDGGVTITGGPPWGFDLIFFDRQYLHRLAFCRMRLGETWWDYWLPLNLYFLGATVKLVADTICLHQAHSVVSSANFLEYGRLFDDWLVCQTMGTKVGRIDRFDRQCTFRFAELLQKMGAIKPGTDRFIGEILCQTIWAGLCRATRANRIHLYRYESGHHRFLQRTLTGAIAHLQALDHARVAAGSVTGDDALALLVIELDKTLPHWRERLGGPASPTAFPSGHGFVHGEEMRSDVAQAEAMNAAGDLGKYWPSTVDRAIRNAIRRLRGRPRYAEPPMTDARIAAEMVRRRRRRPIWRALARADWLWWRLTIRSLTGRRT